MILNFRCPDRAGILAAVTSCLFEQGCDIRHAAQHGDPDTGMFFVRMLIAAPSELAPPQLRDALAPVARSLGLDWHLIESDHRLRVVLAVSREGHCLNDLLHRWHSGLLPADIVGVVSNHEDFRRLTEWYELPFHHLPVTPDNKPEQEAALLSLLREHNVDLLVLARYMQILSPEACRELNGRCINIHHSFLPSFKGAKPYHRAYARGVKLVGATAHYVTEDLDEGPIIEQDVVRVSHATSTLEMTHLGREVEARVLARAVRWHLEHRVMLNGHRTIVFEH